MRGAGFYSIKNMKMGHNLDFFVSNVTVLTGDVLTVAVCSNFRKCDSTRQPIKLMLG